MYVVLLLAVIYHQVKYSDAAGKSILDYDDSDIERLYQEWEVGQVLAFNLVIEALHWYE